MMLNTGEHMNVEGLSNPVVKAAITAWNNRDRAAWMNLFAPDAALTDDGNPHDFIEWSDGEIFGDSKSRITTIDREEDDGLTLYARLSSERWGDFNTFMKFQLADGKITRLDVGQA